MSEFAASTTMVDTKQENESSVPTGCSTFHNQIRKDRNQYYYCYTIDLGRRKIKSILKSELDRASLTTGTSVSEFSEIHQTIDNNDKSESANENTGGASKSSEGSKQLEFADIYIREYARTLGDNPSCSNGPPIS